MNAPLVPLGRSAEAAHRAADGMLTVYKPLVEAGQRIFTLVAVGSDCSPELRREVLKLGALLGANRPEAAEVVNDVGLHARAEAEYKARHGLQVETAEEAAAALGRAMVLEDDTARGRALMDLPPDAIALAQRHEAREAERLEMIDQAELRGQAAMLVAFEQRPLWRIALERLGRNLDRLRQQLFGPDPVEPGDD